MLSSLDREKVDLYFKGILRSWESACLMTREGELLGLHYETLSDVGTLPQAGQVALKYLKVLPGDLVVLNDPFSGGNLLSNLTLIYGMEAASEGLILVVRTGFRARLHLGDKLDEEGLRIPPTPLAQKGVLMEPLLKALVEHPDAPQGAENRIRSAFQKMRSFSQRSSPPDISWKDYLSETKREFIHVLSEVPQGETKVEQKLESGEVLRLRLEVKQGSVLFDFSGTSPSKKLGLTDSATHGACLGALGAFFQQRLPLTSSVFDLLHVSAPLGSWLNSKYPTSTFRGMTDGVHRVAHLVWQALSALATQAPVASSPASPTWISLEFSETRFFDSLPSGVGAHVKNEGASALHLWIRSALTNSVEQIESKLPLRILQAAPRTGSGGSGAFRGGEGLSKIYEILAPAKFQWLQFPSAARGQNGGEPGQTASIKINAKEILTSETGQLDLPAGSRIEVLTAGGGGYGKIRPPA